MILIGDKLITHKKFFHISRINEIKNTESNSILSFRYNEDLLTYSYRNDLQVAVIVCSIKEAIYANSLNAKYIISEKGLAKTIQKIADNYMFDSKILAVIETNDEIEEIAQSEIDGIIYKSILN